jgi:hypothetical protein
MTPMEGRNMSPEVPYYILQTLLKYVVFVGSSYPVLDKVSGAQPLKGTFNYYRQTTFHESVCNGQLSEPNISGSHRLTIITWSV